MRSEYTELADLIHRSIGVVARGYETELSEGDTVLSKKTAPQTAALKGGAREPNFHTPSAKPQVSGSAIGATTAQTRGPSFGASGDVVEAVTSKPLTRESLVPLLALEKPQAIEAIGALVKDCKLCRLCEKRTKSVPGTGSLSPQVMVIGEGPGADEDRLGLPFVGAAGQYLDKWLDAIELSRYRNAYIANVVKCRPPNNRDPEVDEIESCTPYLDAQIDVLKPAAILVVGRIAAGYLLGREVRMNEVRGKVFSYRGVRFMPTYHPSAVLRSPDLKRAVWEDLKSFKQQLMDGKTGA